MDPWQFAEANQIRLMGHVVACYPSVDDAKAIVRTMVAKKVDIIEVQIPFSEPMADGPVFMAANQKALDNGVTVQDSFELLREFSSCSSSRFVFMTYLNVVFKFGYEDFVKAAKAAGAEGVIIPDLPIEHSAGFDEVCQRLSFANIRLVTPNMVQSRLEKLARVGDGMIYAVARTGVTGNSTEFGKELTGFLARVRAASAAPVGVGFGVRGPEDIKFLKGKADYAIVGTQALRVFQQSGLPGLEEFWDSLKKAATS